VPVDLSAAVLKSPMPPFQAMVAMNSAPASDIFANHSLAFLVAPT
jgi:hypothetical protein